MDTTKAQNNGQSTTVKVMRKYEKELTVFVECEGKEIGPMALLKAASTIAGNILAFRQINKDKFELTVSTLQGKSRLLDGFRVGETNVHGRDITADELVVSFLGLPAYIEDEEIVSKLLSWGVSAVSEVRRRMWPGTDVADGTRFVRVRFTDTVQSLPYSVRFNTAAGPEYFRVLHDRQVRVCRGCLRPDHVLRDCPDFLCRNCGGQGHYARECTEPRAPKCRECRMFSHLCACRGDTDEESTHTSEESGVNGAVPQEGAFTTHSESQSFTLSQLSDRMASDTLWSSALAPVQGEVREADSHLTPSQGEGATCGPTPKAQAVAVEPGRRMDVGQDPHLTSKAGKVAADASQSSKPCASSVGRDMSKQQRGRSHSKKKRGSAPNAVGCSPVPGSQHGHVTDSALTVPDVPPFSTACNNSHSGDLMDFDTVELKKRQNEGDAAEGTNKKPR